MDWLDYRQALGLSFNDNQKKGLFIKRIEVLCNLGRIALSKSKTKLALLI